MIEPLGTELLLIWGRSRLREDRSGSEIGILRQYVAKVNEVLVQHPQHDGLLIALKALPRSPTW